MNERIRELAEQAWDSLIDEMDDVVSEDGRLNSDFLHAYTQRFAELIVRECMDLLEDYTTDVHVGGIQYNVLSADETLQKHFGVEE